RVGEKRADVTEEPRPQLTIDDSVVEREAEGSHVPNSDLALVHPRHLPDRPEREDGSLARRQNRCPGIYPEHSDIRDGERAAGQVRWPGPALLGRTYQGGQRVRELSQAEPAG